MRGFFFKTVVTGGHAGLLEMLCAVRCSAKCALLLGVFLRDAFSRPVWSAVVAVFGGSRV